MISYKYPEAKGHRRFEIGHGQGKELVEQRADLWDRLFSTSVTSLCLLTMMQMPRMKKLKVFELLRSKSWIISELDGNLCSNL